MLGNILSIQEVYDVEINLGHFLMEGYLIKTTNNEYCVLISNERNCCEEWAFMASEDDLEYYIGAELLEVTLTDIALNQKILKKLPLDWEYMVKEIQFVEFKTNKGIFQLAVYNGHNGHYGHEIVIARKNTTI